ncbi:MAG: flagellar hook-length control protein FliK [Pseudorhodoplanes sp.]|nr:flagellar hook-length control protein FliK [Pseudorhodoplanes sp.]
MTSVASESVTFSSRTPQFQRSHSANQAPDNDTPFAMMLEASAPPADTAPRQPEQVKPAEKTAAAPADPKKPSTADTPEPEKRATETSAPADKNPAEEKAAQEAAAEGETPIAEGDLPEIPQTDDLTEVGSDSVDADAVVVQVQTDPARPQPAAAPEGPIAAPALTTPDVTAPAQGESDGKADPNLTVKPVAAGNTPAAEPVDAPVDMPVTDIPERPVVETQGGKDVPEIKGKIELKVAEQPAAPADQTAEAEGETVLPQQPAKADQIRPQVQQADAKPQPAEVKPEADAKQPAEPVQNKPAAMPHLAAFDTETASTPLPQVHQPVATDVASLTASPRAATLMAQTPVPVSGLAVEIAAQARAGNNRFEIRLDPPELGRIDVRLDVDQDGNVKSRLVIERSDTYDLLRRDSSTLERALQQAGLKTSDNGLEFTLRDQGSAQRDAREQNLRNAERGIIPDADIPSAEAASGYGRVLGLGGGVDIRI